MAKTEQAFKGKIALLSACWALASTSNLLLVSVAVLSGHLLAEDKGLAALPVALQWLGTAAMAAPASFYMQRFGRRAGFWAASGIIAGGAGLAAWALYANLFALLCVGGMLMGIGNGFTWYYRFAAAEVVPDDFRSRAISLVFAGGIVAAFAGPTLAESSKDIFAPVSFAGTYAGIIALNLAVAILLLFIRIPRPPPEALTGGRPLAEIARQPRFIVALMGGVVAYGSMVLLMAVTPLAMVLKNHSFSEATLVIQWHVLGMYIPAFFSGHLIKRFGALSVMLAGALFIAGCIAVGLSGDSVTHFLIALALLGVGWNFLFVGSTTLLIETYTLAERAKTLALNETIIFTGVGIATFAAGPLLLYIGWQAVVMAALPAVTLIGGIVIWLMVRRFGEAPPVRSALSDGRQRARWRL
ncbi:MAG: MFS transporter [Alphaproteobacteria bacterium]|nr:MFS transporter [Alphaproteobacteria bacterium]